MSEPTATSAGNNGAPERRGCLWSILRVGVTLLMLLVLLWFILPYVERRSLLPGDSRTTLEHADRLEILSLGGRAAKDDAAEFDGYHVRARVVLDDPIARGQLLGAMYSSLGHDLPSLCFDPHHAIRAERGGRSVDLLICFGCGQVYAYSPQWPGRHVVTIGSGAKGTFERIFTAAGLPAASPDP